MPFHPVVDGRFLHATPSVAFANGAAADMDLLVSWTAEEMRLYPNPAADEAGIEGITGWVQRYLAGRGTADPGRDRARQLVAFYEDLMAGSGHSTPADIYAAIQTDGEMRLPARRIADAHAARTAGGRPMSPSSPGAPTWRAKPGSGAPSTPSTSRSPSAPWTGPVGPSSWGRGRMPSGWRSGTWPHGPASPASVTRALRSRPVRPGRPVPPGARVVAPLRQPAAGHDDSRHDVPGRRRPPGRYRGRLGRLVVSRLWVTPESKKIVLVASPRRPTRSPDKSPGEM